MGAEECHKADIEQPLYAVRCPPSAAGGTMKLKLALLIGVIAVSSVVIVWLSIDSGSPKDVTATARDVEPTAKDAPTKDATESAQNAIAFEPWPAARSVSHARSTVDAAYRLDALVTRSPHAFTGVYLDPTADRVVVTLPDGEDVESREAAILRDFARSKFGQAADVHLSRVKYSLADMRKVQAALEKALHSGRYDGQLTGVGSDPTRGLAVVYAIEDSETMRAELRATHGDKIIFREMYPPTPLPGG
jgi:hypothetical protein